MDLVHAYNQIPLDEEAQKLTVILQGIPNVSGYLDDILITGKMNEEHLKNLEEAFTRLEKLVFD